MKATTLDRPVEKLEATRRDRLAGLYREHHDVVWRLLRRLGLDEAAAGDATHQTFLVALQRLDDIDVAKARSFLCGVAVRVAKKAVRREEPVAELPELEHGARPDDVLEQQRRLKWLGALLQRLPEDLRVVLVLHDLEGSTQREIAEILEIPEGTAASRLRRAREAFDAEVDRALGTPSRSVE